MLLVEFLVAVGVAVFWAIVLAVIAFGIVAGAIGFRRWWIANPPKQPVYDASVRVKPSYAPQIVLGLILVAWLIVQGLKLTGMMI